MHVGKTVKWNPVGVIIIVSGEQTFGGERSDNWR